MKKNVIFMAMALSLALCAGLFVSCDFSDDNSAVFAAYAEAAGRAKDGQEYMSLYNIGVMITLTDVSRDEGHIDEKAGSRKFGDTKQKAVLTFVATCVSSYKFDSAGLSVKADGVAVTPSYGATEGNKTTFTVTVPVNTSVVSIDGDNVFQPKP